MYYLFCRKILYAKREGQSLMPPLTRPLSDVYLIELNRNQFESDPVKSRAEILKNKVLQLIFKVGADIDILIWTLIVL